MEYDPKYIVSVRGKEFTLNKSQIEFESPNYFTACFLGDFPEAETRRLEIFRNPDLFGVIVDYLCGYNVLPLAEGSIPATMSPRNALLNLRADAAFYQLNGLVQESNILIALDDPKPPSRQYLVLGGKRESHQLFFMGISDDEISKNASVMIPEKANSQSYVTEAQLRKAPLKTMKTPESYNESDHIQMLAGLEDFISSSVENYDPSKWKLIGWESKGGRVSGPHVEYTWIVVLKDLSVTARVDE